MSSDLQPNKKALFYLEKTGEIPRWRGMEKRRMIEIFLELSPSLEGRLAEMVETVILTLNRELQHENGK